jgi:hypothetical protein
MGHRHHSAWRCWASAVRFERETVLSGTAQMPAVSRMQREKCAIMERLGLRQVAMNATSRDQWDTFAEHRKLLSAALNRDAKPGRSRLCILGAGNANDLDLTALLAAHREVHLVDIDSEALSHGAERQGVATHPRLRLHGGLDTTAMLGHLSDWTPTSELRPADFEAMASWPAFRTALVLPSSFDRVASTCVLSQILETAAHALGRDHRQLDDAQAALTAGHLRLMASLAAPGGEALVVTDVARSEMIPELPALPARELARLLTDLGRTGNHFRRVHPRQIMAVLSADPCIGQLVAAAATLMPWRWRLHDQTYLVAAISFRLAPG